MATPPETLRGSCLCGGVTFVVTQPFIRISQCHCTTCKRISGGGGTATGRVATGAIEILTGRELIRTYQPDEGTAKSFCGVCGSNLFGSGWPDSELTGVRLTALDPPFEGKPDMHMWVRSVAAWETLPDDGLARYEEGAP
jgi:hypothetical protein